MLNLKIISQNKFPYHYLTYNSKIKTTLKVVRFNDLCIYPFVYEKLLYAYQIFLNNGKVTQQFARMIYTHFKEHMDPII
jgi:hypothetical protein